MTKECNSLYEQGQKLVAELIQLQQSVERLRQPSLSLDGIEENEEDEYDGDIGDGIVTEKSYDPNSDGDNVSVFYDSDGDDDARSYFPCPFCYVEIEVPVLCSHLQEEHCFDLNNAVCPLCAANLGKEATGHFIVQHSSLLKRRRKSEKSNSWSGAAMLGRKLVKNARGNRHEPRPDPLLSPFVCNASVQKPKSIHQDELSSNHAPPISDAKSVGDEEEYKERKQRAEFVQQLAASTVLEEIW